ncbi:MAG: lysophospholipid acyltransferase family protein [bacterium]|nr:lysophospholipid acyltransferase family protein [bacterium]
MNDRLLRLLCRRGLPAAIRLLGATIRTDWVNDGPALARGREGKNCIYCFWHNRLLLMPYYYPHLRRRKNLCAMTSMSRDGEYIAQVLGGFGFEVVRGSSSRGGEAALLDMAAMLATGLDAAITPDGPRGPRYRVQPGVVILSQMSGVPIYPATYDMRRKRRLASWDRFIVPMPFTKAAFVMAGPISVPENADAAGREEIRRRLEETMRGNDREAARMLGIEAD